MRKAIAESVCSSAEELLNGLSQTNKLWSGLRHLWVFRGHSNDERYKLKPTALREDKLAKMGYTFAPKEGKQSTNRAQIEAEFQTLHEFYWAIDSQGLHVPGDSNFMRTPRGWEECKADIWCDGWPIDQLLPLLALAQHYGVPTRLIDWTKLPLVAAFFAAKGAATKTGSGHMSIWALNLDWIINTAFPSGSKMSVYVVTAPRASNPNLHAQGGIFTTEKINNEELDESTFSDSVDSIVEKKWQELAYTEPVMAHFTLPWSESKKLLRLLNQEGINSANLFPGYKGVADSLAERALWDIPERSTYWVKKFHS